MFDHKSITDPIYGYVGLSEVEADIVSTAAFQRLHNVRQLGLAHLVFPSAGYSRFSHSVGACHTAGRILDAIQLNAKSVAPKGKKKQLYRLAALLHDIGHYPFSHATETAVLDHYVGDSLLTVAGSEDSTQTNGKVGLHHEEVGGLIIREDPEIQKVLSRHGFKSEDLIKIFSKAKPDSLFGLISSDLDCDRLDYLRRSAHACGVPYGEVDVDFIVSKATIDQDGILCFEEKASSAIDHFLISRFYDYMQVVFHKTVVGLEWSLKEAIAELLRRGMIDLSSECIASLLQQGKWHTIDDNFLLIKFREALEKLEDSARTTIVRDHLRAILFRRPPKLVFQWESLALAESNDAKLKERLIKSEIKQVIDKLGIDEKRITIVQRKPFPFSTSLPKSIGEMSYGERARSVSVLQKGKRKSVLLSDLPNMLVSSLFDYRKYSLRVLYLPQDGEDRKVRDELRKELQDLKI